MKPWKKRAVRIALLSLAFGGMACGEDEASGTFNICDDFETPYTSFNAGMTVGGDKEAVRVRLVAGDPAPPKRGNNRWTLQVLDANDQPLADAQLTKVKPFMPDHGHGTSTVATSAGVEIADLACDASPKACRAQLDSDGRVEVSGIDLRMAGVWTVTVSVLLNDGSSDDATFAFCIDG